MKLTPQEQETLDSYEKYAPQFAASRNKKGDWQNEKELFYSYLPQGKLLELGAGGGRDAKDFIARGYDYIGIDISKALTQEAKKNTPEGTFLVQSLYELDFPPETFDGFWACAVLLHMPKPRIGEALQSIYNVLKPQGVGFISLKKGEGERFVEGDHIGIQYKRFFSFWEKDEFTKVLKDAGFTILQSYEFQHTNKAWLAFFIKKII